VAEKFQEAHAVVDRLLLEQREYSPVELLLAEGRLSYSDYEAWRCGQIATLEEVLAGNPLRISNLLEQAGKYALLLGLQAERREFIGWGASAGRVLRFSGELEELCSVHYRRAGTEVQLDLFMDNSGNVLADGIVAALTSRRAEDAFMLLDKLLETDAGHPRLGVLEALCNATQRLAAPVGDCLAECEFMENYLAPLAARELGAAARDFLVLFWRRLALALRGQPFVADTPFLHASYALGCARDWAGVKVSILEDWSWQDYPLLRTRMAEAEYHQGERQQALAIWCRMCWDYPVEAEQAFAPDRELQSAWERYRELDVEPELDIRYFPAWLLLERKDTQHAVEYVAQDHGPIRAYCALHELLASGSALSERTMELRLKLKQAHPGLFAIYLRSINRC